MPYRLREERLAYLKRYRGLNHRAILDAKKSYWKAQRLEVLLHYSNGILQCACCGEKQYEFMSLDHMNNDGAAQRRQLGSNYLLSWLIKQGFPRGYQVLCHNCNLAKGFYGTCPHKDRLAKSQFAPQEVTNVNA